MKVKPKVTGFYKEKKSITSNFSQKMDLYTFIFSGKIPLTNGQMFRVLVGHIHLWVLRIAVM